MTWTLWKSFCMTWTLWKSFCVHHAFGLPWTLWVQCIVTSHGSPYLWWSNDHILLSSSQGWSLFAFFRSLWGHWGAWHYYNLFQAEQTFAQPIEGVILLWGVLAGVTDLIETPNSGTHAQGTKMLTLHASWLHHNYTYTAWTVNHVGRWRMVRARCHYRCVRPFQGSNNGSTLRGHPCSTTEWPLCCVQHVTGTQLAMVCEVSWCGAYDLAW